MHPVFIPHRQCPRAAKDAPNLISISSRSYCQTPCLTPTVQGLCGWGTMSALYFNDPTAWFPVCRAETMDFLNQEGKHALSGNAKKKVEPLSGWDSTQILPPSRCKTFLQIANPIPVPSNSFRPCNRWKMIKILSKY